MAGVTDKPFRSFMREMGCGVITSELVSARALQGNNQRTHQLVKFSEDQRPYGIQIFGEDPYHIGEGAKAAEEFGPDFIDLNLGCPVNKIVKKGAGSALLRDLKSLSEVLHSLRASVQVPVSLKIRTGWDEKSLNADQVAHIAFDEGFAWMSIHGRTRAQAYSGKADWNYIQKISQQSPLPVVGNGDLISGQQAFSALKLSDCFAVMVGRGCLNNPWIFLEAMDCLKKHNQRTNDLKSRNELRDRKITKLTNYRGQIHTKQQKQIESAISEEGSYVNQPARNKSFKLAIDRLIAHLENFYDERLFLLQLKKFSAWFSAGFPHSTDFRKNLFQEKDKQVVLEKIDEFFAKAENYQKPEPVYEPFLMRGHG